MDYLDKLKKARTKRIMKQDIVSNDILLEAINHARFAANARNDQNIRYILINNKELNEKIFNLTNLPVSHNISLSNQPQAYIIIGINNTPINDILMGMDIGISYQIIREYLFDNGLSDVGIYSFNKHEVDTFLDIDNFHAQFLVAIGYSDQVVHLIEENNNGTFKNDKNEHCVRKIPLEDIILRLYDNNN